MSRPPPVLRPPSCDESPDHRGRTRRAHVALAHPSPRSGMTLLTGTKPTQRAARRVAKAHAREWARQYGYLLTRR